MLLCMFSVKMLRKKYILLSRMVSFTLLFNDVYFVASKVEPFEKTADLRVCSVQNSKTPECDDDPKPPIV